MRPGSIIFMCTLLLALAQCTGQHNRIHGMGEGIMNYTMQGIPDSMLFYDHPDGKVVHRISFHDANREDHYLRSKWFNPRKSDTRDEYGNLTDLNYTCLVSRAPWHEVVVNESTGEKYWIKDTNEWVFMQWPEFIAGTAFIRPLDDNAPVYLKPDTGSARSGIRPRVRNRSILEVDGEWMKVAYFSGDTDSTVLFSGEKVPLGWMRWRSGDSLLIDYEERP